MGHQRKFYRAFHCILVIITMSMAQVSMASDADVDASSALSCTKAIASAKETLTSVYHDNDASILIQVEDHILVSKNFGGGVSEDSRFLLGSVTKTLHAAVATRLISRGELSLEDSVVPLLPSALSARLPSSWSVLKVRNLMHHTSGIEDYLNRDNDTQQAATDRFLRSTHDLTSLVEFQPLGLEFVPDTGYRYSNTNYLLLGYILEEKSGIEDHSLMEKELITPLALPNTGTIEGSWESSIRGTSGIDPSDLIGVGNAYSSARDLMTFLRGLDSDTFLASEWVKKMYLPDADCHGDGCGEYGLGFSLRPGGLDGHDWVYHEGKLDTVSALVAKVPALKLNMTVVSDKIQYDNAVLAETLLTRLIKAGCLSAQLPDDTDDNDDSDSANGTPKNGGVAPSTPIVPFSPLAPIAPSKPLHIATKPKPAKPQPQPQPQPQPTPSNSGGDIDPSQIQVITE